MSESVELVFRVQTQGKQQLDAIVAAVKGVSDEVRLVNQNLGRLDASLQRIAAATERTADDLAKLGKTAKEEVSRPVTEAAAAVDKLNQTVQATDTTVREGSKSLSKYDTTVRQVSASAGKAAQDLGKVGTAAKEQVTRPVQEALTATDKFSLKVLALDVAARYGGQALGFLHTNTVGLVKEFSGASQQTEKLASALGLSIRETERWQAMTRLSGASLSGLEEAASRIASALDDTTGAGKNVIAVLRDLGVGVYRASGETRDYGQVAQEAVLALSQVEDRTKRYAMAQQLLGRSGARDLAPLLEQYQSLNAELDQLGIGLDEQVTRNLSKAGTAIDKLDLAWQQFRKSLAERIAPIVVPVVVASTGLFAARQSPGGMAAAAQVGGPGASVEDYRSFEGMLLDDARDLWQRMGPGLGPGAELFSQQFTAAWESSLPKPPPGKPPRTRVDNRASQFQSLLDSLDQQGLDPLAKLLANTQDRLRALVAQYGPLTEDQQAAASTALQGALRRQMQRHAPGSTAQDLATTGFQYGALRTLPTMVDVDPRRGEEAVRRMQDARLAGIRQYAAFQERILDLTAGPGGELGAIEQIRQIRLQAAQDEFTIRKDALEFSRQRIAAEQDAEIALAELRRKNLQEYRNTAGQVYDALTRSGGGGLRDFFRGQLQILQRQIFVNASTGIFQQWGSALGRVGAASGLGGLLTGTLFDPANANNATLANTTATDRNTLALERNTAAQAGGALQGGLGGLPGLGGADPGTTVGTGSTLNRWVSAASTAAIVGGGTYGIIAGLRQGGARGATTAIASGLGIASTIPGPQQPFVQAAALVAGLVTGLFPDAKEQRAEEIASTLQHSRYTDSLGVDRFTDQYGRELDYNRRGDLRVVQPVTVHVQAMDARGFLERAEDIGNAVKVALQGGHDVADAVRGLVFVR